MQASAPVLRGVRDLFHEFFRWMAEDLGRNGPDGLSWSAAMHGSLNLWNLIEGTHVLTIMFFAGTIWIIDLRMMGIAFKTTPFSKLNDKVLPITIFSFAAMIITGVMVFFGRDPLLYYHNIWFRAKMLFLLLAAANIFWFHYRVQKDQETWDTLAKPPAQVRLSGAISMTSWLLIIILGRFIAYDWFYCDKMKPGTLVYALEECDSALSYLKDIPEEEGTPEEPPPTDSATPPADAPAETPAPATPAPAQPVPGNGG
jgi:Family of unknown function (DUF6644)